MRHDVEVPRRDAKRPWASSPAKPPAGEASEMTAERALDNAWFVLD